MQKETFIKILTDNLSRRGDEIYEMIERGGKHVSVDADQVVINSILRRPERAAYLLSRDPVDPDVLAKWLESDLRITKEREARAAREQFVSQ